MNPVSPSSQNPTPLWYPKETNEKKTIGGRHRKDFLDDQLKKLSALPDRNRARDIFASLSAKYIEAHIDRLEAHSLLNLFSLKQLETTNPSCLTARRLQAIFSRGYIESAMLLASLSKGRLQCLHSLVEKEVGLATFTEQRASNEFFIQRLIELLDLPNSLLRMQTEGGKSD